MGLPQNGCAAVAVLLHYFFLVTFMWMLMEGAVLYVILVKVFVVELKKKHLTLITVFSYGMGVALYNSFILECVVCAVTMLALSRYLYIVVREY